MSKKNGECFGAVRTCLAPMRGIVCRWFIDLLRSLGGPDEYISEFFRVHPAAAVPRSIATLIADSCGEINFAVQLLGRDPPHFVRIAKLLQNCGAQSINLNFGCPMPKIRKKGVGGALLLELDLMDEIIASLIGEVDIPITVKMRIGYYSPLEFPQIIAHLSRHSIGALYLHLRSVRGLYGEPIDFTPIKKAKEVLSCPVIANGDIKTTADALSAIVERGADGAMIGRAAISNPWIFRQIGELSNGLTPFQPSGEDYFSYAEKLANFADQSAVPESRRVSALKRYAVPMADFVDPGGQFPYQVRRATTIAFFLGICEKFFRHFGSIAKIDSSEPVLSTDNNSAHWKFM
jgi:tRNA-dihydrouridine synthase